MKVVVSPAADRAAGDVRLWMLLLVAFGNGAGRVVVDY